MKQIIATLLDQSDGMRMRDIAADAASLLGEPIPRSSIKSCLSRETHNASGACERIGRGRYRLRLDP